MKTSPFKGSLFLSLFLTIFCTGGVATAQENSSKPNILFIIVDDLRTTLGAYGDSLVQTPNMDQLAANGFLFENSFATVPVCGASRAALLSGRKPTTNRFLSYDARLDEDIPEATSLPEYFKDHGYYTVANGKIFDNFTDSADSWNEPVWGPTGNWTSSIPPDNRGEDLQKAYQDNPALVTGPAFERLDVDDASYPDGKIADKTIEDLKRLEKSDAPFFIAMGLRKPHLPFNAPDKYWAMYDEHAFELPETYSSSFGNIPRNPFHQWGELRQYAGIPRQGSLEDEQALNLIKGYHAAVSYADAQVGKVLDALQDTGLDNNTIVVLIGDHGFNLGEHSLWTKHTLFDLALRAPLIIRDPRRSNGRINGVTDFLDLFPTLTELAGLPDAPNLDGVSLVPALDDPSATTKEVAISRWFEGSSVRTPQYRYTEWRNETGAVTARMLFDLKADPEETINIAEKEDLEELVADFNEHITRDNSNSPWSPVVRNRYNRSLENL